MAAPILVATRGHSTLEEDLTSNNEVKAIFLLETAKKILVSIQKIHIVRIVDMFVERRHLFCIVYRKRHFSTSKRPHVRVI